MKYFIVSLFSLILVNCATQQQATESVERSYSSAEGGISSEDARQIRIWDSKTGEGSEIGELPEYDPADVNAELLDIDQYGVAGLVHKASLKCSVLHVTVKTVVPQTLTASCDGAVVLGPVPTSTGTGTRTPRGTFTVYDKIFMAYSGRYNNAPMARFLVFKDCGSARPNCIGIHATVKKNYSKLGQPASKGCIRLTMENAVKLWDYAIDSGTVTVTIE